jgi:predicted kinase
MSKLVVMVGLPASGKTTRARQLELELGAVRLTPDEWMLPLFNEADGRRDI